MKNKSKKKPKEHLIENLLEDLKNDTSDSSLRSHDDGFSDLLNLESFGQGDSPEAHAEDDSTQMQTAEAPKATVSKTVDDTDDKTTLLSANAPEGLDLPSLQTSSPKSVSQTKPPEPVVEEEDRTRVVGKPVGPSPQRPASERQSPANRHRSSAFETQFTQAENLKIAQNRILELEREIERLRKDNEILSSAGEISKQKLDEFVAKVHHLEKQKQELKETNESELRIFKDGLVAKDTEISRLRNKVEELESRLSNDLRKVRVRERELENRLELAKAEKAALLRAKDENILELKRKTDSMQNELENYQNKIIELNQRLEGNQDQFARTVRALRIALTNLEVSDGTSTSITLAPLKKAD